MHIRYDSALTASPFGRLGLSLLFIALTAALLAPLLVKYSPAAYTGDIFHPPCAEYWLGTNEVGQDIWAQLIYGARTSLTVAGGTAVLAVALSLLLGGLAAILGSLVDRVILRLIDIWLVLPPVIVVTLFAAYLRPSVLLLITLLAAFMWPGGARIVRAQTLVLKNKASYAAATTFGAPKRYLLRKHILPDLGPTLSALFIQYARRAIFMEAGLSFLGISDPGLISWGKMMQQAMAFTYLDVWQWWLLPPGLAVSLTIAGLAFTGLALETVLDPRLRSEKR
ncbi:ABC transporter permease [Sporomusa acidovorans]|uniref:Dipeptide transport system permease protein DppC n=1 Tax=Sporomusa acidovorans (strain ATCC 49682 / DSM 3132 / Mol) TaxID=1123286 RepID=A0ABZ3IY30_SPOA4|nr:ABC transporter permease [Sporomusa acidovorans]OZC17684.1 dipeptide transport system permease protein DppC [Sporomusa acidovorans DSM 3132]SDE12036.1 peptide/nickel transport system permease protein [Sporomusa acidovorans]